MGARHYALLLAMLGFASAGSAHQLSATECAEGSEFIMHAAMSRDNGLAREEFIQRMRGDIMAIQSVPKDLRWFVQDRDDEALLVGHAEGVFDTPQPPQVHQSEFMQTCMARREQQARMGAGGTEAGPEQ
jgi:hypothetical protein